jgi:hypothetical protein
MVATPYGFQPARTVRGYTEHRQRLYRKDTTQQANSALRVGDPVKLMTDGSVSRLGASDATGFVGVVAGIRNSNKRPKTFEPNGAISATADADWVSVYDDPGIVFEAAINVTAAAERVGQNVYVAYAAPAGQWSGAYVDATVSAGAGGSDSPFKIWSISTSVRAKAVSADSGYVQVVPNNHAFAVRPGTA